MSRIIETKLARLEGRAVRLMSDMTNEQLTARIEELILLHPGVHGQTPAAASIESRTD
jgi:hypothetical protein